MGAGVALQAGKQVAGRRAIARFTGGAQERRLQHQEKGHHPKAPVSANKPWAGWPSCKQGLSAVLFVSDEIKHAPELHLRRDAQLGKHIALGTAHTAQQHRSHALFPQISSDFVRLLGKL